MTEQPPADLEKIVERMVEAKLEEKIGGLQSQVTEALERLTKVERQAIGDRATLLVFSGEFDKLMTAFIVASGAVAMGMDVSMYFTFWGLTALKKKTVFAGKPVAEKMISGMLPSAPTVAPTSRMNMMGIGPRFFQWQMGNKNVETLPDMIKLCQEMGVKMIACQMAMDVMGVTEEELIDGIEFGGVATYVGEAMDSRVTLMI
jgi:peroxiredoxin family protein